MLRKVFQNTWETGARKLGPNWEGPYEITQVIGNGAYKLQTPDETRINNSWNAMHLRRCYVWTISTLLLFIWFRSLFQLILFILQWSHTDLSIGGLLALPTTNPRFLTFEQDDWHAPRTSPNWYPNIPTTANNVKVRPKPFLIRDILIKASLENSMAEQNNVPYILFKYTLFRSFYSWCSPSTQKVRWISEENPWDTKVHNK